MAVKHYKLCYYVPETHLEATKLAVFFAGAGTQGNYEHCCFQTKGQGQFRPLQGSQPFLGKTGQLEMVDEWRVELLCPANVLDSVLTALRRAHPYEEPALEVLDLVEVDY